MSTNLNNAVQLTNIDDVWNGYNNNSVVSFCGENEVSGKDVVIGIIEADWPLITHDTFNVLLPIVKATIRLN